MRSIDNRIGAGFNESGENDSSTLASFSTHIHLNIDKPCTGKGSSGMLELLLFFCLSSNAASFHTG